MNGNKIIQKIKDFYDDYIDIFVILKVIIIGLIGTLVVFICIFFVSIYDDTVVFKVTQYDPITKNELVSDVGTMCFTRENGSVVLYKDNDTKVIFSGNYIEVKRIKKKEETK